MLNTQIAPWPSYTEKEIKAVEEVLRSGKVNQWTGSKVFEFEKKFSEYIGTHHAIAVANGTVALDIIFNAYRSRLLGKEVIVTSRTFVASASSIIMAGAKPVFVDVDPNTQNITPENIQSAINHNTAAILCVHLAGMPCDMDPILDIAHKNDLLVFEDCAQAHGASYKGRKVGSFGNAAAWSFCQDKIMTTGGEGGMITTNDSYMFKKMWSFKDHGKSRDKMAEKNLNNGFRFVHDSIGSNYRMTEMQAAIGLVQLERLDSDVRIRNFLAHSYDSIFVKYSALRVPDLINLDYSFTHAKYKHYAFVNAGGLKEDWNRDTLIQALNEEGVPCYQGSCSEVYKEKAIGHIDRNTFDDKPALPVAKRLGETSIMFLVHPNITVENLKNMLIGIDNVLKRASKVYYA